MTTARSFTVVVERAGALAIAHHNTDLTRALNIALLASETVGTKSITITPLQEPTGGDLSHDHR